jgi:hypothetical protein
MGCEEGGGGDGGGHVVDGAKGDGVECAITGHRFDAMGPDLGGEMEGADGFVEEGGLLGAGLGQGDVDFGAEELDGESGEAGAGTVVEEGAAGAEVSGGEEALAEVAADDVLGGADGGEVEAGVPLENEVEIGEELGGERGGDGGVGGEEGGKGFGGHEQGARRQVQGTRKGAGRLGLMIAEMRFEVRGSRFEVRGSRFEVRG